MFVFGLDHQDIAVASREVGRVLGVFFELRGSTFYGGDYYLARVAAGKIYVQSNLDILDSEPFEQGWPIERRLLVFDGYQKSDWDPLRERLPVLEMEGKVRLLRVK